MATGHHFEHFGGPKTLLRFTVGIAEALEMQGVDSQELFARAGVPFVSATEQSTLIDVSNSNTLYALAVEATRDPSFGLSVAQCIPPTLFKAAGYSLYASNSLHDFCQRLEQFFGSLNIEARQNFDASYEVDESQGIYRLVLKVTEPDLCFENVDTWVAYIVKVCRGISGPRFAPKRVELIRPVPTNSEEAYHRYFRASVHFAAKHNAIYFDKKDICAPALAASGELAKQFDDISKAYILGLDHSDVVKGVKRNIVKLLPTGDCSRENVAKALNVSARSLNAKLSECDTSYQELLEELRSKLAQQYLDNKHLSLTQIGYQLGFSDTSSFARAFRRWTGQSPSKYRSRQ